ncbi:MAG TPA: hypothetical protein ENJ31_03870, partial [Anaerolineae bacterium]|nr:hypothetical protein [Anaerolineae bacterium]
LTLDAAHQRLYASPPYDEGQVTIVDTASLTVLGDVSPNGFVALDSTRNRFYVGNRMYAATPEDAPGIRVYDSATLEQVGEIPQPGIPVYNPLRDELHIVGYTVYRADPETLQVTGDLLPEITAQPLPWCNGCRAATNAHVYPDRNLLIVEVTTLSAGKGPGTLPPPRFFDATSLEELTDLARLPAVERGCGDRLILAEPVQGRVYRGERYSRYVFYNNLLVYDLEGRLLTWRDGLPLGVTNPNTGQMYLPHGDDVLVLDLATLSPVGSLPPVCIHTLDAEAGRIYALSSQALVVFSQQGGWPQPPPTGAAGPLPGEEILAIQPSPTYAQDRTLFVKTYGKLYRSTDGGQTWARLRGGLPEGDYLSLDLAVSPDFVRDRTLFVGGFRGDFWGEGVYRSTDGGESWQPMWGDLTHLRVYDVAISPDYAADGTLLAYSRYQRLNPWESGYSVFRSADRGLSWTQVMTRPWESTLPAPEDLLPAAPSRSDTRFRVTNDEQGVERSTDGGRSWEPVLTRRQPEFRVRAVLPSPEFAADRTVYVLSETDLFRSTDGGDSWERWLDARLTGRDYFQRLTAGAIAPLGDGGYRLFLGTAAGEFWSLDPAALVMEPVAAQATPAPTPMNTAGPPTPQAAPTPTACALSPAAPFAAAYGRGSIAARLGCPTAEATVTAAAYQPFERGLMFWRADEQAVYVLYERGEWARYPDRWDESQPPEDPSLTPPDGLQQPVRGFGKVWREQLGGPQAEIGWALESEMGYEMSVQPFSGGQMFVGMDGWGFVLHARVFVLYADGTWE